MPTSDAPESTQNPPEAEGGKARRTNLSLNRLLLDPNNYRFRDEDDYRRTGRVDLSRAADPRLQEKTQRFILGPKESNVQDLLASLRQNGWVDVEPIHVRRYAITAKFLVIEGNRRVATLRHLQHLHQQGADIGRLDPAIFKAIPCLEYPTGNEQFDLLVMGLHHISGKRPWHALNQAEMLDELRNRFSMSPEEICRSLGIQRRDYLLSIRSLSLCRAYQQSDYGDQFSKEKYNLFREVLRTPSVRTWIGWDDATESAKNRDNLELLFSWLSRESGESEEEESGRAERPVRDPILNTAANIKELGRFVEDPSALRELDRTGSIQKASLTGGALVRGQVTQTLDRAEEDTGVLLQRLPHLKDDDLARVEGLMARYRAVLSGRGRMPSDQGMVAEPWAPYNTERRVHLRSLVIQQYRGLRGLELNDLGRFNLIVGLNNAGKTSVLETIQLLVHQSDSRTLLEIARRRVRSANFPEGERVVGVLPAVLEVSGTFDDVQHPLAGVRVRVSPENQNPTEDRAVFVAEAEMRAWYGNHHQRSRTIFGKQGLPRIELVEGQARWLCRVVFSSPFVAAPLEELRSAYADAIGVKDQVVDFLGEHTVPGLRDIAFVGERFLVLLDGQEDGLDLAAYGDGTQRVFHLALLVASARDGILIIDEFENALHTSLQGAVVRLLGRLAGHFNVQVFASTHSLEAVDAWLADDLVRPDFAVYGIQNAGTRALRYAGPDLEEWRRLMELDPRWPR